MSKNSMQISGGIARHESYRLRQPIDFALSTGQHLAIVGPNGSGKSLLVDTLLGKYPLKEGKLTYDFSPSDDPSVYANVKYIAFRDSYGAADTNYYYQQRWNSTDTEDAPLVRDMLGESTDVTLKDELYSLFGIEAMLDKRIILLSSGELRKLQLTKTLLSNPRVLIMDNPFIGLDANTRDQLHTLLKELTAISSLQVILVLSKTDDIPAFITHVVPVEDMICGRKIAKNEYMTGDYNHTIVSALDTDKAERIINLPYRENLLTPDHVVELNQVSIRYGDRTILKELDWTILRGEKWALSGENGSGKSTLLSLVCADNPQSYACDISLFGRKRGTGESIWDIKTHIGYVSPEMHRAYLKNIPTIEIVASGLHDSIGLYRKTHPDQLEICRWWMDIFGISGLADRPFLQLSSGEQRLALLARAFVKDPELLILDEPLHGLDMKNRRMVKEIVEAFCHRKDKTMIFVTHYENELPACITNRLVLKRNK